MKKKKVSLVFSCALAMLLALNSNAISGKSNQAYNNQTAYATKIISTGNSTPVVLPCNDGTPAI